MKCKIAQNMNHFTAVLTVLFVFLLQPVYALAFELRIRNDFDKIMRVALVYFETDSNRWRTTGWYAAEPRNERRMHFKASKSDVYIYARLEDESMIWGDGDFVKTVISDAFSYYDEQECPWGNERKIVKFTKYEIKNNVLAFRPREKTSDVSSKPTENNLAIRPTLEINGDDNEYEADALLLLDLINAERRKVGSPALRLDENMHKAAKRRAVELSKKYSHDRPNGSDFSTIFSELGFSPSASAENIACMSGIGNPDIRKINKAFMDSVENRVHILNSDYSIFGLGLVKSGNNYYVVELFADVSAKTKLTGKVSSLPQAQRIRNADNKSNTDEFQTNAVLLLDLINAEREKVGAPILRLDESMCKAAKKRAAELTKKYSHDRPDGSNFSTVFVEYGLSPLLSAENIAWRSGKGNTDIKKFNKAFMDSDGHRANMLNRDYSIVGLGFSKSGIKYYVVELFAADSAQAQNEMNAKIKRVQ